LRFARAMLPPDPQAAPIDKRSVVVLTGGARGVTAVMAEALLKQYGCRLVLLGRSDPTIVPLALQSLSLDDMDRYETEYYRSERAANPSRTIPELKRAFARLKAAHETWVTTEQLRRLGGVEFKTVDITDPMQLDAAIADIVQRHGSVDLVVHGAGLQISKRLSSRQLGEFRAVVGTKLNGLRNLVASCARHVGPDVPFHILTSAFSALGNDGQPDYGAANEAMAALANVHPERRWTALGWLGWAAVGMTRGSEYAALGNSRGLRAVLPEEGKALFLELLQSKGGSPAVSLLSEGEIQFYKLPVAEAAPAPAIAREPEKTVIEFPLSVDSAPYLNDHKVNGVPVLPGTFEVEFALRAAQALRPNHPYLAARNPRFHRFVRVAERGTPLRVEARLLEETAESSVVGIRLLSDFVHRSGVVLQPDVLHFEGEVLTSSKPFAHMINDAALDFASALPCPDPYLAAGSPVKLGGVFACLHDIRIGPQARTARYQVSADKSLDSLQGFISPVLLLDALFRLVGVAPDGDVTSGEVSVPLRGDTFHFTAGVTDRVLHGTPLSMVAANPRIDGEFVATDWGHVVDAQGRILVSIAGAYARRMGTPTALAAS
ncbi:MAG: SDR family NAD(P)-dependent oxidoreductase, partial [Rhodospirillaceae bacterium]